MTFGKSFIIIVDRVLDGVWVRSEYVGEGPTFRAVSPLTHSLQTQRLGMSPGGHTVSIANHTFLP